MITSADKDLCSPDDKQARQPSSSIIQTLASSNEQEQLNKWIQKTNQQLSDFLVKIKKNQEAFLQASEYEEKEFYNNAALQKMVMKQAAINVEQLKISVDRAMEMLSKQIKENQRRLQTLYASLSTEVERYSESRRQEFIRDLIRWQESINRDYRRALDQYNKKEIEFKDLEKRHETNQKNYEEACNEFSQIQRIFPDYLPIETSEKLNIFINASKELKLFLEKQSSKKQVYYKDIVKVVAKEMQGSQSKNRKFTPRFVLDIEPRFPSLPKRPTPPTPAIQVMPDEKLLQKKTFEELDGLAILVREAVELFNATTQTTGSPNTTARKELEIKTNYITRGFKKAIEEYRLKKNKEIAEEMTGLSQELAAKVLSFDYQSLITKLENVTRQYKDNAVLLKKESEQEYRDREGEYKSINKEMIAKSKLFKKACLDYENIRKIEFKDEKDFKKNDFNENDFNEDDYYNHVVRFDFLEPQYKELQALSARCGERVKANYEAYEAADKKYGLDHHSQNQASFAAINTQLRECNRELNAAQITRINNDREKSVIGKFRNKLKESEIVTIVTKIIEDNMDFWHAQVSDRWGSYSKFNRVEIPKGIKLMHDFLHCEESKSLSAYEKIIRLKSIAADRISAATGFLGLFSRSLRKQTTNKFYKVITELVEEKKIDEEKEIKADQAEADQAEADQAKKRDIGNCPAMVINTNTDKIRNDLAKIVGKDNKKLTIAILPLQGNRRGVRL